METVITPLISVNIPLLFVFLCSDHQLSLLAWKCEDHVCITCGDNKLSHLDGKCEGPHYCLPTLGWSWAFTLFKHSLWKERAVKYLNTSLAILSGHFLAKSTIYRGPPSLRQGTGLSWVEEIKKFHFFFRSHKVQVVSPVIQLIKKCWPKWIAQAYAGRHTHHDHFLCTHRSTCPHATDITMLNCTVTVLQRLVDVEWSFAFRPKYIHIWLLLLEFLSGIQVATSCVLYFYTRDIRLSYDQMGDRMPKAPWQDIKKIESTQGTPVKQMSQFGDKMPSLNYYRVLMYTAGRVRS